MEWNKLLEMIPELVAVLLLAVIGQGVRTLGISARARELAQRAADLAALLEMNDRLKPEESRLTPEMKADRIRKYLAGQNVPAGPAVRIAAGAVAGQRPPQVDLDVWAEDAGPASPADY